MRNKPLGFTLIELMITVAVVGILAAIAYPSYRDQIEKSRRTIAEGSLTEIASKLESYRFRNKSYTQNLADLGYSVSGNNAWNEFPMGATSSDSDYRIKVVAADSNCPIARCYLLLAEPRNRQASDLWQYRIWSTGRKQSRQGASGSWSNGWPSQ
jgi:type IV pilus assembly protein PilE